jgi:hypothetical protein
MASSSTRRLVRLTTLGILTAQRGDPRVRLVGTNHKDSAVITMIIGEPTPRAFA